jgi:hypothetical protein
MIDSRRPVRVFVSYAHRDQHHLEALRAHLCGLERSGEIRCWWDGAIGPGIEWEAALLDALHGADVVLLLVTAQFMLSDFCIESELRLARERETRGEIDLVPIWVESVDLGAFSLGRLQFVKYDHRPVAEAPVPAAAWADVARQVRLKVQCIAGRRPVLQALNEVDEVVCSGDVTLEHMSAEALGAPRHYPSIGAFWRERAKGAPAPTVASVRGTLSVYAPMLMGPPAAKRALHREFRQAIESDRRFGQRKRLTINACMSISAGQMVHREARAGNDKRLLGLYESIVRNALPVFVLPEFHERVLRPAFERTTGAACFEARVTGRLFELDNRYIRRFLSTQGMDRILPADVVDDLCRDAWALEVGGPGTGVEPEPGPPRYLDGDLWIAVQSGSSERFLTGFVDLGDEVERRSEMARLRTAATGQRIIATADELRSIGSLIDPD